VEVAGWARLWGQQCLYSHSVSSSLHTFTKSIQPEEASNRTKRGKKNGGGGTPRQKVRERLNQTGWTNGTG